MVTEEPIRISYQEDGALLMEGIEMMQRGNRRHSWQKWLHMAIVVIVCAAMACNWALRGDMLGVWVAIGCMPLLMFMVWRAYFSSKKSKLKSSQKLYRQTIGRDATFVTCDFASGGYSMTTNQGNTSQQTWTSLSKAVEHPEGILLYTGPKIAQWFPKRFFTPSAYEQVVELVRNQAPNFERANVRQ